MNVSLKHHASVYRDLNADTAARNRAARAELPCSECGSEDGMQSGWTREAITNIRPMWVCQLYSCTWDDHELYTPCLQCNPWRSIPGGFTPLTPEQVAAWLARECQCPDCRRERGER